jgi:hypothetical protein
MSKDIRGKVAPGVNIGRRGHRSEGWVGYGHDDLRVEKWGENTGKQACQWVSAALRGGAQS